MRLYDLLVKFRTWPSRRAFESYNKAAVVGLVPQRGDFYVAEVLVYLRIEFVMVTQIKSEIYFSFFSFKVLLNRDSSAPVHSFSSNRRVPGSSPSLDINREA